MGLDIHRMAAGRPLLLGGVRIPHSKGLLGHSDADVLLHAVCDALLGAVGAGDIGTLFPDTDPRWKGIPSRIFVEKALELMGKRCLKIANVDLVVIAEAPRISPHRQAIQRAVAQVLRVGADQVNLKARTMEGLGPIGSKRAIAATAVVLLEERK